MFWKKAPVESPCTRVCRIEAETGLCAGCLRSMEEIRRWPEMPDPEKKQILKKIQLRMKK